MKDKRFCMSSYLMFRYVYDRNRVFFESIPCEPVDLGFDRVPVKDSLSLYDAIKDIIEDACRNGNVALALSGGIDSAILARLLPIGTKAYTFRCIVPGKEVSDESELANHWACVNGLDHEIIDIYWDDLVKAADQCMKNKGAPIHSIEAQIYLAGIKANRDGITQLIFGENADIIYGGMDGLLSEDWTFGDFVKRYTYIMPYMVLKDPMLLLDPFRKYEVDGHIDGYDFTNYYFRQEALGTYINACDSAGIMFIGPYSKTFMDRPIDYKRIRSGESKYIIRELFKKLYPGEKIPEKVPMPRPMNEWMSNWEGPQRAEFIPNCTNTLTGDQRWMVWCLERFLNTYEREIQND